MAMTDEHYRPSVGEVLSGLSLALGVPIRDIAYDGPGSLALRKLRPIVVYVLHRVHGYTPDEVAAAMGCSSRGAREASCRVSKRLKGVDADGFISEATNQRKDRP